jgi:uncharacterized protein
MKRIMKAHQATAILTAAITLGSSVTTARADALADGYSKDKVKPAVTFQVRAFDLRDVRILDGAFKHAEELDGKYLLALDPDRLLHTFRLNAQISSTARPLAGWEAPSGELRGHFIGHYMSACAMMFASTGDARYKSNAVKVVKGLAEVQAKLGNTGFLSAWPETFIDRVEARQRVWAPYYTLHKIYAGFLDVYDYCDDSQALDVVKKMGDWAIARNGKLTDAQMQNMLGEEHGGMNEALANLYGFTGDEKYLAISQRFNHLRFVDSLAKGVDNLDNNHANTQFPKFLGAVRQYELTGKTDMLSSASNFWYYVVNDRSYVIGGNSDGEQFSPKARLSTALGQSTTETCNTYNMLRLTRHLHSLNPKVEYADFFERGLFNQILGSQHPEDGGRMTYYYRLQSGSTKDWRGPDSFVCCAGSGIENHAKYGDSIYFHSGAKTLYVDQFIASELNWREAGVKLKQETTYPDEPTTKLTITAAPAGEWTLQLRHPAWVEKGFSVKVNGQAVPETKPGTYAAITRAWKAGDTVEVQMPFQLHTEGFKDNPNRQAVMFGPVVLAAIVTSAPAPAAAPAAPGGGRGRGPSAEAVQALYPKFKGETTTILKGMKPVAGKANTFTLPAELLQYPQDATAGELTFEPLYKIYNKRYMVYFDRAN